MNKYITILESGNNECPNVGTISTVNIASNFKKAIEEHFDANLDSYSYVEDDVTSLNDCINAVPIDILVKIDADGIKSEHKVELSQTWIYNE